MKLFATSDIACSIRAAIKDYTHVVVNRAYTTLKPVHFRTILIADLPIYQWASWNAATSSQLKRWRAAGGVLLDQNTYAEDPGPADVMVFVECPMNMERIARSTWEIAEYMVIPRPHTWKVHEQCLELRAPPVDKLKALWSICGRARMTDDQLAAAADLPKQHAMYMRASFKPVEEWELRPRIKPDFAGFHDAWEWIGTGLCATRKEVTRAGLKAAVKEMARLGHITLTKVQHYPDADPDWEKLERKRVDAIADLASVRSLVASLPDHLEA